MIPSLDHTMPVAGSRRRASTRTTPLPASATVSASAFDTSTNTSAMTLTPLESIIEHKGTDRAGTTHQPLAEGDTRQKDRKAEEPTPKSSAQLMRNTI